MPLAKHSLLDLFRLLGAAAIVAALAAQGSVALAAEWEVRAEVDKPRASKTDVITYRVSASGAGGGAPRVAHQPNLDDFLELGTSSATSIVTTGGQVGKSYEFVWRLSPRRAGRLELGGVVLTIGQERYEAPTVAVEVADTTTTLPPAARRRAPAAGLGGRSPSPSSGPPAPSPVPTPPTPVPEEGEDYFLEVAVGAEKAFVGEPFAVDFELFRAASLVPDLYDVSEPNYLGFWSQEVTSGYSSMNARVTRAGRRYTVEPVRSDILVPIEPGELSISPVRVEVPTSAGLFQGTKQWIASPTRSVRVEPLPAGAPPGFDPANVGRGLQLEATIRGVGQALDTLRVGDSVVLSVAIDGEGLVEHMRLVDPARAPELLAFGPELESSETEVSSGRLLGRKRFKLTYVPTQEGALEIPAVRFVFFDFQKRAYETIALGPWAVSVAGDAPNATDVRQYADAQRIADQSDAAAVGSDGLPGPRSVVLSRPAPVGSSLTAQPWYWAIMVAMPLAWATVVFGSALRRRRSAGAATLRVGQACGQARRALSKARRAGVESERAGAVAAALLTYLSEAFQVRARAVTGRELARTLTVAGVSGPVADAVTALLERAEAARYAPATDESSASLLTEAERLLDRLEAGRHQDAEGAGRRRGGTP